ncbi:unnamed protein product [Heterobilharzia americana]|nr:unnamed protein product [Heterobilharzia americana]
MTDGWDAQCKVFLDQHKCLQNLCITGVDGHAFGTSSPDFRIPCDLVLKLIPALTDCSKTSFNFMDEKYIILTRDPHWLISKCGKKTIILYCTGRICLFGQAIDGDMNNCNPGNLAMSLICDFYKKSGF